MTGGSKAGLPFLGGFSSCYGRSLFKPQNLRFEDQIEVLPYSFRGVGSAKIPSLGKTQETPIIGVVPY